MAEEKHIEEFEESLGAYKSRITQVNKATLTWDKELIFIGRTNRGPSRGLPRFTDAQSHHEHQHRIDDEEPEKNGDFFRKKAT